MAEDERMLQIVGGGRMGEALLGGMLAAGRAAATLAVAEVSGARREELARAYPGVTVAEAPVAAPDAVLAVKPGDVAAAAAAVAEAGAERALSVAAGVTTEAIESAAGGRLRVVRAMPNTPALIGAGAAAICAGAAAGEEDLAWAESVLGAVGVVVRVPEQQLDAVTGLSGSGPAYVFLVAEALAEAGVLNGLPRDTAETLAFQTLSGAARLLAEGDASPAELRAAVTSPGGTTAAGLAELERHAVRAAVLDAVTAATRALARARRLARRQRHDLEALDVHQPAVGDLQRRDHRQREERERHERRLDRDAEVAQQRVQVLEAGDDLLDRPVGEQAGDGQRELAHDRAAVGDDDPAADLLQPRGAGQDVGVVDADRDDVVRVVGDGRGERARGAARSRVTSPRPTRPVAWWRSITAILARSRDGSATTCPFTRAGSSVRAIVISCSGTISITRTSPSASRARSASASGALRTVPSTCAGVGRDRERLGAAVARGDATAREDQRGGELGQLVEQDEIRAVAGGDRAVVGEPVGQRAGAASPAAARPRPRSPRPPRPAHIWLMWPSCSRKSGSRSSVQNAQCSGP